MPTFIALLRSINAGGFNTLTSKNFVTLLETLELASIKTYIQTGNAVFQTTAKHAKQLPEKIQTAIKEHHGFAPEVVVLSLAELEAAITNNPYPKADENPKSLHLTFLKSKPKHPDLEALEKVKTESETFSLVEKVFYFYAPEGVGRSKAFGKVEKSLGVSGTARNWRTVNKLLEMAKGLEEEV
jgi:uncharacterized protein (DUF1697 family)